MSKRFQRERLLISTLGAFVLGDFLSCTTHPPIEPVSPAPSQAAIVAPYSSVQERIALAIAEASPPADPADRHARDAAGDRLARCKELIDAAGESLVWGGFNEKQGYDPAASKLTIFNSRVWAKLYLSTFMFPGPHEVRQEGQYTVLEMEAKFRDGLDAGDYPYPFWHSAKKWQGYLDVRRIAFVFDGDLLIAAYRQPVHDPAQPMANRSWDGKWQWTGPSGESEPRASLYKYLLSPENPHTAQLETAYRNLEERCRAQACMSCHAPDNTAQSAKLYMLNYPNQALVARHELVKVLKEDKMPPLDITTGKPAGLHDDAVRTELLRLAEVFEKEADAALKFEQDHATTATLLEK